MAARSASLERLNACLAGWPGGERPDTEVTMRMRGAASLLLTGSLLLGCNASTGSSAPAPSAPAGGAVITAQNTAFDRGQLNVPAGRPFQLLFENREGVPHNVTI